MRRASLPRPEKWSAALAWGVRKDTAGGRGAFLGVVFIAPWSFQLFPEMPFLLIKEWRDRKDCSLSPSPQRSPRPKHTLPSIPRFLAQSKGHIRKRGAVQGEANCTLSAPALLTLWGAECGHVGRVFLRGSVLAQPQWQAAGLAPPQRLGGQPWGLGPQLSCLLPFWKTTFL